MWVKKRHSNVPHSVNPTTISLLLALHLLTLPKVCYHHKKEQSVVLSLNKNVQQDCFMQAAKNVSIYRGSLLSEELQKIPDFLLAATKTKQAYKKRKCF